MIDRVMFIDKNSAVKLINNFHYSKVLPRINKHFIGGYRNNELVAVCTLGYGVRPRHTIEKLFDNVEVNQYLEIGKLCVDDKMPRNSESNFIAKVIDLIKKNIEIDYLFSWADGIIGKPGYVYQASNFYYGGFIWTEMYLSPEGVRVHARTMQGLSNGERVGKFKTRKFEVINLMGYTKYFGKQFRYIYPLNKKALKNLNNSSVNWTKKYPKMNDCIWKRQISKGVLVFCDKPNFTMGEYIKKDTETSQFSFALM